MPKFIYPGLTSRVRMTKSRSQKGIPESVYILPDILHSMAGRSSAPKPSARSQAELLYMKARLETQKELEDMEAKRREVEARPR